VTTEQCLIHAARNYYRIPLRDQIDRQQPPPGWMNLLLERGFASKVGVADE
jgi:hypothetical protein